MTLSVPHLVPFALTIGVSFCTFASGPAFAAEDGSALLIQWDNDKVVDTDRHYTNGFRIAYSPDTPTELLKPIGDTLAHWFWFTEQGTPHTGIAIGQNMYTPENVDTFTPDPLDRPYAGWTYLGLSAQNENEMVQDTVEVDVGIIGPSARAGQTQNAFHRVINSSISHGWRNQINDEPGLLITRTYKLRSNPKPLFEVGQLSTDIIGHGTAQLGNVHTGAGFGATVRLGHNLHEDFGPIYGTFALPRKRPDALSYTFFAGAEARAVVWDIFLDGNTFSDSPDVDKNPYIMEARVGFTVHSPLPDNWSIKGVRATVNMVHRTREFTTQDKADRYGSFQLTLNF